MATGKQFSKGWRRAPDLTRRRMIQVGALGGTAAMAGCLGNGDDPDPDIDDVDLPDPDDIDEDELPDRVRIDGQRLILPWTDIRDPSNLNPFLDLDLGTIDRPDAENSWQLFEATMDHNLWGRWWHSAYWPSPGDVFSGTYEAMDFEHDRVVHRIAEDAFWSDGTEVTAWDAAAGWLFWRAPPYDEGYDPSIHRPFTGLAYPEFPDGPDGKVVEFHTWREDDPYGADWQELGLDRDHVFTQYWSAGPTPRDGLRFPAHVEPWASIAELAWEDHLAASEEGREARQLADFADAVSESDYEDWIDGDSYVSTGAWTLDELVGTEELILKPNPYHRDADDINFDEVVLEWNPDDTRIRASLQAGVSRSLDYAVVEASPESIAAMPSHYEEWHTPAALGRSIHLDHSTEFGDVRVRQAMMYAINARNVANNVHATASAPVITPGGDMWARDAVISDEWVADNLLSYDHDPDRAAELMQEAGYSRAHDGMWERDGDLLQYPIATDTTNPVFEETIVAQLGEFGIDLRTQTFDPASFEDRRRGSQWEAGVEGADRIIEDEYGGRGDFAIWTRDVGDSFAGFYEQLEGGWWSLAANAGRVRRFNMADHSIQEQSLAGYAPAGWVAGLFNLWEDWTIEIPPVGDPTGELEPFNPWFTSGRVRAGALSPEDVQADNPYFNPDEGGYTYWEKLAWAVNWYLPVLPVVRMQTQHFLNRGNWVWPMDGEMNRPTEAYMMDYFGLGWNGLHLASRGSVYGDARSPKLGTEVVEV